MEQHVLPLYISYINQYSSKLIVSLLHLQVFYSKKDAIMSFLLDKIILFQAIFT